MSVLEGRYRIIGGDCVRTMRLAAARGVRVDAVITDPPYHLQSIVKRFGAPDAAPAKSGKTGAFARASRGFMGQKWDGGDIAFQADTWRAALAIMKPGAHLAAFCGTRNYHRMACAIEDAGFDIRDSLAWLYGQGMPKAHNIGNALDKMEGRERRVIARNPNSRENSDKSNSLYKPGTVGKTAYITEGSGDFEGYGTALKPALELICLARAPLAAPTIAENCRIYGTGALNIDATRISYNEADKNPATNPLYRHRNPQKYKQVTAHGKQAGKNVRFTNSLNPPNAKGRYPANVITDGSDEVMALLPESNKRPSQKHGAVKVLKHSQKSSWYHRAKEVHLPEPNDSGNAARFFYSAKADEQDRVGSGHPTIKPRALMQWLVRLLAPPGAALILDPFAGSGTTGAAALIEGHRALLIEKEKEYIADCHRRIKMLTGEDTPLFGGSGK